MYLIIYYYYDYYFCHKVKDSMNIYLSVKNLINNLVKILIELNTSLVLGIYIRITINFGTYVYINIIRE